ncbi:low molecular weight protein-tyrosine-phosphatase [Actinomycetospora sp. TBRC 11914]|uniref:low molecular weight protein-tyrosine-phosphatase n=1 Tax=Actinomycetospora sp. TBRC 11914 TaxID=2729387 RepID=UPI00145FB491|nr:low molecular weight protein-tyrosine-phosphatase [Actinomycetospora sp. TBRC 11914]NMO90524.1 low molecular weight phosphotyrosine protein phosphatase [Actinomycetospora sp. TBRC 11914]
MGPRERCYSVVTVCTGNICRSPMAEVILRAALTDAGLADRVVVTSAGVGDWHVGEPMDRRAAATLADRGYGTDHVARQIDETTAEADLVLAATTDHARDLIRAGVPADRVRLLRSFDPAAPEGAEVPDPYYGGPEGFDEVFAMLEAATPGVVAWARERV